MLRVSHGNKVVRVTAQTEPNSDDFDVLLNLAHHVLSHFRMSSPGSTWGCDGVSYAIQKRIGTVAVQKSGVGPKKYQQGRLEMAACETCKACLQ